MIARINKGTAYGSVIAPPSKSMAHRYLICGALSGKSTVKGVSFSEDIKATLSCLEALGATVKTENDTVTLGGINNVDIKNNKLFCNESGSTLRFLIPLCLTFGKEVTLFGTERLLGRSLSVYEDMCKKSGIEFIKTAESVTVNGKLEAGKYSVRGDISSQFISGLMFALPLLKGDSTIEITENLESGSYLDMTVKALSDFGIRITKADSNTYFIKGEQTYKPREISVEGDYSNAAFLDALNCFGGNVGISGLDKNTCQGDSVYKRLFSQLSDGYTQIDISDCPDLGPILMTVAAAKNGAHFVGTRRLKIKESDRGAAMAEELSKFGCKVILGENEIWVEKSELKKPELPLYGHNDHRIVMSLAILSTLFGGEIYGAEAVAKSFPDFFDQLSSLGIEVIK